MPRYLLGLAENRILVEQLKLLLGNESSSVIPAVLLALLLVTALSNDSNALEFKVWFIVVIMYKIYAAFNARRILASTISLERAPHIVWRLIGMNALHGFAWGALAWITLDNTSVAGSILVVSVLAGIAGSSMSLLSPVLPVFIIFFTFELIALASKLLAMGDPAYNALSVAGVLYVILLFMQGRNSALAARAAINLRFENIELMDRLRIETEKAQTAHRKADEANLAKSKFLAAASHDLRQPIHAQGLFLEVLARSELSAPQHEMLASARAAAEASADMLNTLLDFSHIDAGVVKAQVQPFHLQPLLNKIENELAPLANAKALIYRSRETNAVVQSDPVLVELILRNLVSNAIRYTEHGGILVTCRTRGNQMLVEVWDTGIGIAPSQQQEVFREFHQLGNAERDRRKGLGLGLAIADGLACRLGHELSLASKLGHGSVFRLSLPITRIAVTYDELETTLGNHARILNARILVIEDDEAVRAGMCQLLRDWGCECEAVTSMEEAQSAARIHLPDLILCDYRLHDQRTGVEIIAALREELGAHIPALLITGDTAPDRLRETYASGLPLLHKPVSPALLYQKLLSVLADHKENLAEPI